MSMMLTSSLGRGGRRPRDQDDRQNRQQRE